jgi:hypothetical protein
MLNEICTVSLGKASMDNDYTFYQNGKIKHFHDRSIYDPNIVEWLEASQINDSTKNKILENCSTEYKGQVSDILYSA